MWKNCKDKVEEIGATKDRTNLEMNDTKEVRKM